MVKHRSRLLVTFVALFAVVGALAACAPPNPGPQGLFLGQQGDIHPVVTPEDKPITWGAAPVIDDNYGGTLYAGTGAAMADPRPGLVKGDLEPLRMWVADPNDGRSYRPAIVWLHGGGFAKGVDSMYGLAKNSGADYAKRGYVGFSVEYRTDTTVIGSGAKAPSLCQWVQDNEPKETSGPAHDLWVARRTQCERNIAAAQHDAQAAVRYLRTNAERFHINPTQIAVGGFSAGAVTASNLAFQSEDIGDVRYFPGDDLSIESSKVQAAFGASGCTYAEDGGAPSTVGAGDAPTSFIHSEFDMAVPYGCAATTVRTAQANGLTSELHSYCGENGHANSLYNQHRAATDDQWTTFLARELGLYTAMPAFSSNFCPGY